MIYCLLDAGPGGGGSAYADTGHAGYVSSTLTTGSGSTPGNSGDSDRGNAGNGATSGQAAENAKVMVSIDGGSWTTYNYNGTSQILVIT